MNRDYLFYLKPPKAGPYSLDDLGDAPAPIGSCEDIKQNLASFFPAISWCESRHVPGAWFGTGPSEFQFTSEPDGQVLSFMASQIEARQVRRLVRELNLIALEVQHDVVFA
ncbi:hypothetical protein FAZ69_14615 [Trinickia terrae]|uniref:Uncharacterized protein n=1 Tax=Trinickia terrae TaxID=2571161 RepID=A0A4U1I500_9BURK|nr:hypothetical protein [Trinickia terrae]TKC88374.1 hypothetical protein FAZ69_14615 [Trinickia terrae]